MDDQFWFRANCCITTVHADSWKLTYSGLALMIGSILFFYIKMNQLVYVLSLNTLTDNDREDIQE